MKHIARFGVPRLAISDNGNTFIANLYQDIMKTFGIEVKFTPAYHPASNGAIERRHQTIKNALKASLVDMGSHHGDKWMRALPWVLLGKRIAFQPDLDTSAALLLYGRSPEIPGQVLGHPGPPLNNPQTRALLEEMYKLESNPALQTSAKVIINDIKETENASHVYIKREDPKGHTPRFEGPFEIVSRPSHSQIQIRIGSYANGDPRLATYNWRSCKIAHLRDGFVEGSRPALGRKKTRPDPTTTERQLTEVDVNKPAGSVADVELEGKEGAKIQTDTSSPPPSHNPNVSNAVASRPIRSTRNPNPSYIDSVAIPA